MADTPPPPIPVVFGPQPPQGQPAAPSPRFPPPRQSRAGLVAVVALSALILMVGTGFGVWFFTRPKATTPSVAPSAAGTLEATGVVTLKRGQFVWQSLDNPTCEGLQGFSDIRAGTQVTVTDASGKVLAVGSVDVGQAQGITTEADGMHRATTCILPFKVPGIPRGVGPYGVEVGHRGVLRYNEGDLSGLQLGFS